MPSAGTLSAVALLLLLLLVSVSCTEEEPQQKEQQLVEQQKLDDQPTTEVEPQQKEEHQLEPQQKLEDQPTTDSENRLLVLGVSSITTSPVFYLYLISLFLVVNVAVGTIVFVALALVRHNSSDYTASFTGYYDRSFDDIDRALEDGSKKFQ